MKQLSCSQLGEGQHSTHSTTPENRDSLKDTACYWRDHDIKHIRFIIMPSSPTCSLNVNLWSQWWSVCVSPVPLKLSLCYSELYFNCPDVSPTIEQIDQSFGATRPGVYDEEKKIFTLTFRGLAFEFPAETKFQVSSGWSGCRLELVVVGRWMTR